jgi:branched-chain amino acid transport system substrate-binding protein
MGKRKYFIFLTSLILGVLWASTVETEEIVIGFTGPLSGPAAEYGQDCLNGIEMAINEINAAGGIIIKGEKYLFKIEKMDDRVNPQIAEKNALKLRKELKCLAIFNPVFTTITSLMKINTERGNEFLLMAYTSAPEASETNNKLIITIINSNEIYIRLFAEVAWEKGWRKCAVLLTSGSYGEAWRKKFIEEWRKKGGVITADHTTNYYTRTDFSAPLSEILASQPDFILIGGPSGTTALIIEQARARGFEGGFVMSEQSKLETIRDSMEKPLVMEGAIGIAMANAIPYPASDLFKANYGNDYKRSLTLEVMANYCGMYALAKAIYIAGTVNDVTAIRESFSRVYPMLGDKYPMEVYGISTSGRVLISAFTQEMKHGRFTRPRVYVWWVKTQEEFERIKKMTHGNIPMTWYRIDQTIH